MTYYLSDSDYRNAQADLFEQDARGQAADHFEQQAQTMAPMLVQQAQDQAQQQRNDAADAFEQQASAMTANLQSPDRHSDPGVTPTPPAPAAPAPAPTPVDAATAPPAQDTTPAVVPDQSAPPPAVPSDSAPDAISSPSPAAPEPVPVAPPPAASNPVSAAIDARGAPPLPTDQPAPQPAAAPPLPAPAPTPAPVSNPVSAAVDARGAPPLTQTTVGLSGGAAGVPLDNSAQGTLSLIGQKAQQYGLGDDGARAAQAVGVTEGALVKRADNGDIGDHGQSFGPFQFLKDRGQLPAFAAYLGVDQATAGQVARDHPDVAIDFALRPGGYLGDAIRAGQQKGLTGAALATYAQANGQVSVSPERAGANFNALFSGGSTAPFDLSGGQTTASSSSSTAGPGAAARTSQFGMGLSQADAYAFCGPAAAIAFANTYGRFPTVAEAKQLAQQVGWNPDQGMAGVASEQKLMSALGVPTKLETQVDWNHVASDANNGNPVVVSTPGHYFYVDGAKQQQDGATVFHVGTSGTDLKQGSEWMTPQQMQNLMGTAQGALYADNPAAQGPSIAERAGGVAQGLATAVGGAKDAVAQKAANLTDFLSQLGRDPSDQELSGFLAGQPKANTSAYDGVGGIDALKPGNGIIPDIYGGLKQGVGDLVQGVQNRDPLGALGGLAQTVGTGASVLPGAGGLEPLIGQTPALVKAAGDLAPQLGDLLTSGQPAMADANFASGGLGRLVKPSEVAADQANLEPEIAATLPQATPDQSSYTAIRGLMQMARDRGASEDQINALLKSAGYTPLPDNAGLLRPLSPDETTSTFGKLLSSKQPAQLNLGPILDGVRVPDWITAPAQGEPVSLLDAAKSYRMGNLISSPATLVKVGINSVTAPAWTLLRDTATLGRLHPESIAPEWASAFGSLGQAGGNFLDALTSGSGNAVGGLPTALSQRVGPGLPRVLAKTWELPGNLHGAMQAFASTVVQQAELGRLAGIEATSRGYTPFSNGWWQKVADLSSPIDTAAGATVNTVKQNLLDQATAAGQRASLRGDLGTIGSGITSGLAKMGPLADVLVPIRKIPINDFTQTLEKSPIGLAGTAFDVGRAALGNGPYAGAAGFAGNGVVSPLGERLASNLVGSAVTAFLAMKAMDGTITGSGPTDPQERATLAKQGWQPNSIQIPGQGWVSWTSLPPGVSEPLRIVGNYADIQRFSKPTDSTAQRAGSMLGALAEQMTSQPGLQQAGQIYDMLKGAATGQNGVDRAAASYGAQQLDSLVPMGAVVKNLATGNDPNARQVPKGDLGSMTLNDLRQDLPAGTPLIGGRDQLPVRQDLIGRPDTNPQAGLGALLPRTGTGATSATGQALGLAGMTLPAAPPNLTLDNRLLPINPDEQQLYERARGDVLEPIMQQLVANPRFATAPRDVQDKIIQQYVGQASKVAEARVLQSLGSAEISRRLQVALDQPRNLRPAVTLP